MVLELHGLQVDVAHDGRQALEAAARHRPDAVLLDIGLPGLNGYDVCREMRRQPWSAGTRILAMTGWGQQEDRRRSAEAGFDDHLVKPVDFEALLRALGTGGRRSRPAGAGAGRSSALTTVDSPSTCAAVGRGSAGTHDDSSSAPIIHAARPSCAAIDANSRRERPGSYAARGRRRTPPSRWLIHHGDVSAWSRALVDPSEPGH